MEILVFVVAFMALAALSACFGEDNRETLRSHEAELAARGFKREQWAPVRPEPWAR
jgi:hypothetical protein